MLPYFPFPPVFDLKMGTAALPAQQPFVEMDDHYNPEVLLKRSMLNEMHSYYYRSSEATIQAQWEVVDCITSHLAAAYPENFSLNKSGDRWRWHNHLLDDHQTFLFGDKSTLPFEPLDWIGRQVQEDLILLNPVSHLAAGQLCFPSGWSLDEKFEKHFLELHAPLPKLLSPMLQSADKVIERIPFGKPIARTNWGFRVTNQLDLSPRHADTYRNLLEQVSTNLRPENAGEDIFLRIERQTLSRLPQSGYVLFTIHTYHNLVSEEIKDPGRKIKMFQFLKTVPAELLIYKQMNLFADRLVDYLSR